MSVSATTSIEKVILAAPRGYCAGVDRAVQTVEQALDEHGAPIYVRKEIVHNKHVVEQLTERGAIFVEEETEVPEGVDMATWALAWCLQHPAVSCVIPGCKSVQQVESNAASADLADMVRDDHPQAWTD